MQEPRKTEALKQNMHNKGVLLAYQEIQELEGYNISNTHLLFYFLQIIIGISTGFY